jgi:hypothetical protein
MSFNKWIAAAMVVLAPSLIAQPAKVTPKQVVDAAAFVIENAFVDEARAKEIATQLRARSIAPAEGTALAKAVTDAIWSIEDDGHLNVRFDPAKASEPFASMDELKKRLDAPDSGPMMRRGAGGIPDGDIKARVLDGNIGYFALSTFQHPMEVQPQVEAAMKSIENTKAVIVDLRQNRGGTQQLVDFLASYFFPADDRVLLTGRFRGESEPTVSRVVPTPTRKFETVPLYILISDKTFSAGEAFAYILQQFGRATVVGQKTRGGGRHNRVVDIGGGYRVSVSIATVEHPKTKTAWQSTGVIPDVATGADEALDAAVVLAGK